MPPAARPVFNIKMALKDYSTVVLADTPVAYFRMDDSAYGPAKAGISPNPLLQSVQYRESGGVSGHYGGYANSGNIAFSEGTWCIADDNPCTYFNGLGGYAYVQTDIMAAMGSAQGSVECWMILEATTGKDNRVFSHSNAGANLLVMAVVPGGTIALALGNVPSINTGVVLTAGLVYHVVLTYWFGNWWIYVNGVLRNTGTFTNSMISGGAGSFWIGGQAGLPLTTAFGGRLDEFATYSYPLTQTQITAHYQAGLWTDVTDDWRISETMSASGGIMSNRPQDRVAQTGVFEFSMDNSENNSQGKVGLYSPGHPDCLPGFDVDTLVGLVGTYAPTGRQRWWFTGRLREVTPSPGEHASRVTKCVAQDYMGALAEDTVTGLEPMTTVNAGAAIQKLFAALSTAPPGCGITASSHTFASVFDKSNTADASAMSEAVKVTVSAGGFLTLDYFNRLIAYSSSYRPSIMGNDFLLDEMHGLEFTHSRDLLINKCRVVSRAFELVDEDNHYIFRKGIAYPAAAPVGILATVASSGGEEYIWCQFHDGEDRFAVPPSAVYPLVELQPMDPAMPSFIANTAPDGSGTNVIFPDVECRFSGGLDTTQGSALVKVSNFYTSPIYITYLAFPWPARYVFPEWYEEAKDATSIRRHKTRLLKIEPAYIGSRSSALSFAQSVVTAYKDPLANIKAVHFTPNVDHALMDKTFLHHIHGRIGIAEAVTGIDDTGGRGYYIDGWKLTVEKGHIMRMTWFLRPA